MKPLNRLLFFILSCSLLASCQRDGDIGKGGEDPKLSSKDPVALSKAIKVWHGVRTAGTMPSPRGTGIELMPSSEPVKAFAGRYAIIKPEILSGDVKGYYVTLNGSNEYFKVDYTKPRDVPGMPSPGGRARKRPMPSANSTLSGTLDSSLVIVIPASISVPDTFCVSYSAYDSLGTVSAPVTTCIIVSSVGTDAAGSWITGNWKLTASFDAVDRDTVIYNRWIADELFYCGTVPTTGASYITYVPTGPAIGADSLLTQKLDLALATNGGQTYAEQMKEKFLDHSASSCSNLIFSPVDEWTDTYSGAWTFNAATNKLVIIFEFDDMGFPTVEAWEYDVIKISNTHFLMVDNTDPSMPYFIRWQK